MYVLAYDIWKPIHLVLLLKCTFVQNFVIFLLSEISWFDALDRYYKFDYPCVILIFRRKVQQVVGGKEEVMEYL